MLVQEFPLALGSGALTACTFVHILRAVGFEWDERKARANLRRHNVDFADAVAVLEDQLAITIADDTSDEERFVTVGCDVLGRILVVVYTVRDNQIRLISARKATRQERRRYEGD